MAFLEQLHLRLCHTVFTGASLVSRLTDEPLKTKKKRPKATKKCRRDLLVPKESQKANYYFVGVLFDF